MSEGGGGSSRFSDWLVDIGTRDPSSTTNNNDCWFYHVQRPGTSNVQVMKVKVVGDIREASIVTQICLSLSTLWTCL